MRLVDILNDDSIKPYCMCHPNGEHPRAPKFKSSEELKRLSANGEIQSGITFILPKEYLEKK